MKSNRYGKSSVQLKRSKSLRFALVLMLLLLTFIALQERGAKTAASVGLGIVSE